MRLKRLVGSAETCVHQCRVDALGESLELPIRIEGQHEHPRAPSGWPQFHRGSRASQRRLSGERIPSEFVKSRHLGRIDGAHESQRDVTVLDGHPADAARRRRGANASRQRLDPMKVIGLRKRGEERPHPIGPSGLLKYATLKM